MLHIYFVQILVLFLKIVFQKSKKRNSYLNPIWANSPIQPSTQLFFLPPHAHGPEAHLFILLVLYATQLRWPQLTRPMKPSRRPSSSSCSPPLPESNRPPPPLRFLSPATLHKLVEPALLQSMTTVANASSTSRARPPPLPVAPIKLAHRTTPPFALASACNLDPYRSRNLRRHHFSPFSPASKHHLDIGSQLPVPLATSNLSN